MVRKIEISHKTIIFTVLFLLGLWLVYYLRGIILQIFVAFLLMTMLEPIVGLFKKAKIPRVLAIIITYILVLGIFGGTIALIAPTLVQQTTNFINALPGYLSNINMGASGDNFASSILNQLGGLSGKIFNITVSVFSNILSVITVLVFTFYLLLTHDSFQKQIESWFGENKGKKIMNLVNKIEYRLGKWASGQLLLMLIVGSGVYLGFLLLRIPYALPLGLLAGLLEVIPTLGPIAATIPAALIGFGNSPLTGFGAIAVVFLVNQLENYILVPKVMQKSAGISPLLILLSIAIGAKLAGFVGVIIAVPSVIILQVLFSEYLNKGK